MADCIVGGHDYKNPLNANIDSNRLILVILDFMSKFSTYVKFKMLANSRAKI